MPLLPRLATVSTQHSWRLGWGGLGDGVAGGNGRWAEGLWGVAGGDGVPLQELGTQCGFPGGAWNLGPDST